MTKRYVWIDQRLLSIVALGGKASEPPPSPDFSAIAQADANAAQAQLGWAREQFNTTWPYAQQYLQSQIDTNNQERTAASQAQDTYNTTYRPAEVNLANEAETYNSPERATARAGSAMADVTNTFAGARGAALQQLESYGIDPSQTRFGALDLGTRVQEAAATAAAGTQSRLSSEATGLALQGDVVNIGRGYPGAIAQSYSTATGAGSSGLSAANQTTQTGSNTMGTPVQYGALQNNILTGGYGLQLQRNQQQNQLAANQASGIGQLVGGAIGAGAMFLSDRRLKTDITRVGQLDNGLSVYLFRYKGDTALQIGLMADEVEKVNPDAVVVGPHGFKLVDYGRAATTVVVN